ncbi:hypothetical protein JCM16303_006615 [Sporobolomyces ruberrimus]
MDELSKSDLCKCCLVNRTWLDPARKSLYNALHISVVPYTVPPEDEALLDNGATDEPHSYYIQQPTVLLLATLVSKQRLGALVRRIAFYSQLSSRDPPRHGAVWMRREDALTTFGRLCPFVKAVQFRDPDEVSAGCREAVRLHYKRVERILFFSSGQPEWEDLRHHHNLKAISVVLNVSLPPPPYVVPALGSLIFRLSLGGCDRTFFASFPDTTWRAVRELRVPANVATEIRPLRFPQVERLAINRARNVADPTLEERNEFFSSLTSLHSVEIFEIDSVAFRALDPHHFYLAGSLPSNCRRVTLLNTYSLDAVQAVLRRSWRGHRIKELGLEEWHTETTGQTEDDDERDLRFVATVRFAVEMAGVELIWVPGHPFE